MKLLLDNNLSTRLSEALVERFPDSTHVRVIGLATASDREIWDHAKARGYAIISKDSDFHQMSFLFGFPPKVIWIRRGNCSTREIESMLRQHADDIKRFSDDSDASFLALA